MSIDCAAYSTFACRSLYCDVLYMGCVYACGMIQCRCEYVGCGVLQFGVVYMCTHVLCVVYVYTCMWHVLCMFMCTYLCMYIDMMYVHVCGVGLHVYV